MGTRIEVTPEVFTELSENLRGAAAVAGQISAIIPPYLASRLQTCIAKSQGAVGRMIIEKQDPHVGTEAGAGTVAGQPGAGSS